jgi:hypothetical protein
MQNGAHQHARSVSFLLLDIVWVLTNPSIRIAYFRVLNFGNPLRDLKTRLELIRTLAEAVDDDDFFDFQPEGSAIDGFHGYPGMLSWILNNIIGYNYQKATVEDRTKLAIHLCARTGQPRAAPLVRFLLPEEQAISKMCHYTDYNCRTLLSSAAWALGEQSLRATQSSQTPIAHQRIKTSSDSFKFNAQVESDCLQDLLSLMKDLIIAGSNLHTTAHRFVAYTPPNPGETPLVSLFSGFSHLRSQCMDFSLVRSSQVEYVHLNLSAPTVIDVLVPVVLWIELLFDAGIDLSEYGRKEQELYREGRATSHCWFTVWRRALWLSELDRRYYFEKRFSIRFKYGPKPSDWQFWLIEEMDNSLAEFWDMVDHPERSMPGAWDDRFDDSD